MLRSASRPTAALSFAAVMVTLIACGGSDGPTPPSDSGFLEISPGALTVTVAGRGTLTATVTNASGDPVPNAPVTWVSRKTDIATVDALGVVTGVTLGSTMVVARSGALSDSVVVTVGAAAGCNSIVNANTFDGTLNYDWVILNTSDGSFVVDGEYHGALRATLTRVSTTPFTVLWAGDITGTASFKETRKDPTTPNSTTTLQGEGAMVPIVGLNPKMSLIVDLATCTYQLNAIATLNTLLTDPNGTKTRADNPVAALHSRTTRSLGTGTTIAVTDGQFDGHSTAWIGLNPNKDGFSPLGLSTSLTNSTESAIGRATVVWVLQPK